MSFVDATLEALKGFANEVSTWTNQGNLISIQGHVAQIENAAVQDVHAAETAAKAVWGELYAAFHGRPSAPATVPVAPATGGVITASDAPVIVGESGPETLVPLAAPTVDPTPAPSTTPEASSAPSNATSDASSTAATDTAAPAV